MDQFACRIPDTSEMRIGGDKGWCGRNSERRAYTPKAVDPSNEAQVTTDLWNGKGETCGEVKSAII
jgi:hypothetical protein